MKKFVLIPDSFKGTMTSVEICRIMDEEIRKIYPDADIVSIPVADGGEGSVDAFLSACGGKKIELTVKGPYLEEMTGFTAYWIMALLLLKWLHVQDCLSLKTTKIH